MKYINLLIAGFLLFGCSSMKFGSSVRLKEFQETKLSNGLPVLLMKDDRLPYFSMIMIVHSGATSDPDGLSGLSGMVGSLLEKGTTQRSASEIAESLEAKGANFSASVSKDYTFLTASGLSMHRDQLINDFSEIITQPGFANAEISRVRKLKTSGIMRSADNPSQFVSRVFDSALYGNHPYGTTVSGTTKSLKKIRRKHVMKHYLAHYRPNNAYLAIVGKFDSDIVSQLNSALGSWKSRPQKPVTVPEFPAIDKLSIELVHKSDSKQSQIRFGQKGIQRTSPDFLSLRVANTILGGAFASRLVDEIRKKRGLTYSIGSYFDARKFEGPFVISTFTRHDKVNETVTETLNVIKKFKKEGASEQEVKEAKALLAGAFARAVETPESVARNLLLLRFYGISDSYLTSYLSNLSDVSHSDVNKAIRKHLSPEKMKVMVYSSKSKVYKQLKEIAPVDVKNFKQYL